MGYKKLGWALLVTFVIGAASASQAVAAPSTPTSQRWFENSVALTGSAAVKCEVPTGGSYGLAFEVGAVGVEIKATGIECVNGTISNVANMGESTFKLKLTGATVTTPKGCTIEKGTITSEELKARLQKEGTETVYELIEPVAGAKEKVASIPIRGCTLEGNYPLRGTQYGIASLKTGVEKVTQPFEFNLKTSALSTLNVSGEPALFEGVINTKLVSGIVFGADV